MTIWKFVLPRGMSGQRQYVPTGARFLCAQLNRYSVAFWAIVDPNAPRVERHLGVYNTGDPIPTSHEYMGTIQLNEGDLVKHAFVGPEPTP
jgi:hypothetical protein